MIGVGAHSVKAWYLLTLIIIVSRSSTLNPTCSLASSEIIAPPRTYLSTLGSPPIATQAATPSQGCVGPTKPLPKLMYKLMKDNQLRDLLRKAHVRVCGLVFIPLSCS